MPGRGHARLPKSLRIRRRAEYVSLQQGGKRVSGGLFVVLMTTRDVDAGARFGITVSSKVGHAVVRNRLKRWVREFARQHRASLPPHSDVVIVARTRAATAPHAAVDAELDQLLGRARRMVA